MKPTANTEEVPAVGAPPENLAAATTQIDVPAPSTSAPTEVIAQAALQAVVSDPSVTVPDGVAPLRRARAGLDDGVSPDLSEAHTNEEASETLPSDTVVDGKPARSKTQDAEAAVWAAPVLPVGASPWSEVVSARGTHTRSHSTFTGFAEELPGVTPDALGPRTSNAPPPHSAAVESLDLDEDIPGAESGFNSRRVVFGIVAMLVLFGLLRMFARFGEDPIEALPTLVAATANEVVLRSKPRAADVISVADGRVLGETPIQFLVPTEADAKVIIRAEGYEPQRLTLPERGQLEVVLIELPRNLSCDVSIVAGDSVALEAVGGSFTETHATVPGAAVLIGTVDERGVGARIVRCPELGGEPKTTLDFPEPRPPATIHVTHPAGAMASIDGEDVGRVPSVRRTTAAFGRVEVVDADGMAEARWVPTVTDVEVQMPAPRKRRHAVVVEKRRRRRPAKAAAPSKAEASPTRRAAARKPPRTRSRPTAKKLLQDGSRHMLLGKDRQAKAALQECVRLHPNAADCHRVLGTLHHRNAARRPAKVHLERYLQLRPNAADADQIRRLLEALDSN